MTTYTPGPWTAHTMMPNSKLLTPKPEAYITAGGHFAPGNRIIAAVYHVDGTYAKTYADLIARAPDMQAQIDELTAALEGIFAQTNKHSRQWGQAAGAHAFARDPDTAAAFAKARAALAKVQRS